VLLHLDRHRRRFGLAGFETIYVGGGTPSWLPRDALREALRRIGEAARAGGREPSEWSLEANPEDVDQGFVDVLLEAGVNRLSVGVQSLEDGARRLSGRRGLSAETRRRLDTIAERWPYRWSADLMFGLPGQSAVGLARDARELIALGAGHVSLYELTLEDGTPMSRAAESGAMLLPDDDERADQYDAARAELIGSGFRRYEVSNWAIAGQECAHNLAYWDFGDWLAVGPSGVGNVARGPGSYTRIENAADLDAYCTDPTGSATESEISGKDAAFECLMMAMRTDRGLSLGRFERRFGMTAAEAFGPLDERFPELVRLDGDAWVATDRGLDTLNEPLVYALSSAERFFTGASERSAAPA
jgi:oxygen-independent coproporphyrinogen-3 oxidase